MEFTSDHRNRADDIIDLFAATFTASEGADEGALIGTLARNLIATTPDPDLFVFCALDGAKLTGSIMFSRLTYDGDARSVFVLGPVAVATDQQGKGIGQALLKHGLSSLQTAGVDVAITYGDPNYYGKTGFAPISEQQAPAPFKLQYPDGWLGQSLTDRPLGTLTGPCRCVPAFNDPAYW